MGGGDKCLLPLAGRALLARVIERLRPQAGDLAINANGDHARLASFGLPVIADSIAGHAGPLAGVHAGLEWAKGHAAGARYVVTVAGDTPFFPDDLVQRFLAAHRRRPAGPLRGAVGGRACIPSSGYGPSRSPGDIEVALSQGARKVGAWTERRGAVEVFFPPAQIGGRLIDPFFNINRTEDLAAADALLCPQAEGFKG